MARVLLCPSCKKVVPTADGLRPGSFPFCTDRCKMVDLGKWFGEEYVVPIPIDPNDHEAIERVIEAQQPEG